MITNIWNELPYTIPANPIASPSSVLDSNAGVTFRGFAEE